MTVRSPLDDLGLSPSLTKPMAFLAGCSCLRLTILVQMASAIVLSTPLVDPLPQGLQYSGYVDSLLRHSGHTSVSARTQQKRLVELGKKCQVAQPSRALTK